MPRHKTSINEMTKYSYKFLPGDMVEADLGYRGRMLSFIIGVRYIEVKISSGTRTHWIGPYYDLMTYDSYDDYVFSDRSWPSRIKRNIVCNVYEERLMMVMRP